MSSWLEHKEEILSTFQLIDPSVILVTKDGWFWKVLGKILAFLHATNYIEFINSYATTLGPVQAYPSSWTMEQVLNVGSHECRHTRQCRYFGFGISPWAGLPFMAVAYLLLPLPILFAWCRYRLELDADKGRWQYLWNTGSTDEEILETAKFCATQVSSKSYLFSVPKVWALWGFDRAARKFLGL